MRQHICADEAHRIAFGISPPDDPYFATRLRDGLGERGRMPLRSRTERQQRAWQAADQVGFRACSGEGEAHAARGLDDNAIFKRRRRRVANSAVANSRTLGMASRTVSINQ